MRPIPIFAHRRTASSSRAAPSPISAARPCVGANIASANLTWAPADQPFSGTVTIRYNGAQNDVAFTDPSFVPLLVRLRSFTLVNANANYKVNDQIELFARVENLLDRDYQEVFSFVAQGRAGYAGVRVRF